MDPSTAKPNDLWPDEKVQQPAGEGPRPPSPRIGEDAIFDEVTLPPSPSSFREPPRYTEGDGETPIIPDDPPAIDD